MPVKYLHNQYRQNITCLILKLHSCSYCPGTPSTWVLIDIAKSTFIDGFLEPDKPRGCTTGSVEPLDGINKDVCGAKL